VSATPVTSSASISQGKKVTILLALVALLAAGGWWWWKQQHQANTLPQAQATPAAPQVQTFAAPPVFLPLDSMVVNLADRGGERFAQVGITFEIAHAAVAEQLKPWLPHIRSNILLLLSQRSSDELLTRHGKEQLALDVRRAALRPLGYSVAKEDDGPTTEADPDDEDNLAYAPHLPVRQVLFSSFIIQ